MANTPQAKKRIRRNTARTVVNTNRLSRIRTFIKKVEAAIEVGDKDVAASGAQGGPAGNGARRGARRASQEYRLAQDVAADQARCRALIRGK